MTERQAPSERLSESTERQQPVSVKLALILGCLQLVALAAYGTIWTHSFANLSPDDFRNLFPGGFVIFVFIPNMIITAIILAKVNFGSDSARGYFIIYCLFILAHFVFFLINHFSSLSLGEAFRMSLTPRFLCAYLRVGLLSAGAIMLLIPASNPWFQQL